MKTGAEYLICSAIWYQDGNIYNHQPVNIESGMVVCGLRHSNCFATMGNVLDIVGRRDLMIDCKIKIKQGFITNGHRFVDRCEALQIAVRANQLKPETAIHNNCLYSEDIF